MDFDASRASLSKPDKFKRFNINKPPVSLSDAHLDEMTQLLIFERSGERRGLLRDQMMYHHVAQGDLAGEPYLVTF